MAVVTIEVKLPITIKKKAKVFVSCCPPFDITTQGNTEDEAKSNLTEAIKLFLLTCFEKGTLDTVLKKCGFTAIDKSVKLPKDHRFITVPLPFMVKSHGQTLCHA